MRVGMAKEERKENWVNMDQRPKWRIWGR